MKNGAKRDHYLKFKDRVVRVSSARLHTTLKE